MPRISLVLLAILVLLATLLGPYLTTSVRAAGKPNVVIVITDDQGYGDLSCHGNPVLKTPAIDKLHAESVRLTNYHVSPTCSPTRAAFLTGHWTNRTGVWHTIMGRSMIRENEVTMGQIFQDAGYATGMFGKWHLGDNYPYRPEDRGYTEVMRHGGGGVGQTPDLWDNAYFDGSYFHNGKPTPVKGFCTDVWFDYAKRFIRTQKAAGKPFLAYVATNAPHGPMHSPVEDSEPYTGEHNVNVANFFGMIANIDRNVGDLRAFLKAEGLEENTIFIFTTDNGTSSGDRVFNKGMRGKKGSEYDGGHRVPFFIHWPKGGFDQPHDVETLTAHVDVLPTLLDVCGLKSPANIKFDGMSIKSLLDESADTWPARMLITDSQRVKDPIKWRKSAVMSDRWRLINGKELYDMDADPGQKKDVASGHPKVVEEMTEFYDAWWAELQPTFAADCPIYLGHPKENPARLTSHDWITSGSTPWNQSMVRAGQSGKNVTGFWYVTVWEAGEYDIALRRWPRESGKAIRAELPPGADVPGVKPYRARAGVGISAVEATISIADVVAGKSVPSGADEVVFRVKLPKGKSRLAARFIDQAGKEFGAYYAYVSRVSKK